MSFDVIRVAWTRVGRGPQRKNPAVDRPLQEQAEGANLTAQGSGQLSLSQSSSPQPSHQQLQMRN